MGMADGFATALQSLFLAHAASLPDSEGWPLAVISFSLRSCLRGYCLLQGCGRLPFAGTRRIWIYTVSTTSIQEPLKLGEVAAWQISFLFFSPSSSSPVLSSPPLSSSSSSSSSPPLQRLTVSLLGARYGISPHNVNQFERLAKA